MEFQLHYAIAVDIDFVKEHRPLYPYIEMPAKRAGVDDAVEEFVFLLDGEGILEPDVGWFKADYAVVLVKMKRNGRWCVECFVREPVHQEHAA